MAPQMSFNLELLRNLPDLRDAYETELAQGDLLVRVPVPNPGAGQDLASKEEVGAVDAAVCALRQLYAYVASKYRDGRDVRDEEERYPILRLSWVDFARRSDAQRGYVASHAAAREAMAAHLRDSGFELTFLGLMENPAMHQTLLKRGPFQLFCPRSLSRPLGAEDAAWELDEPDDPVESAERSLVVWNGRGNVATAVRDKLGLYRSRTMGRMYFWSAREPVVVRVRYRAPAVSPPAFEALRVFAVDDAAVFPSLEAPLNRAAHYALILVARLRQGGERRDLLRRYYPDSRMIETPRACLHADDTWKLGEPGREYMLYYGRVSEITADAGRILPEIQTFQRIAVDFQRAFDAARRWGEENREGRPSSRPLGAAGRQLGPDERRDSGDYGQEPGGRRQDRRRSSRSPGGGLRSPVGRDPNFRDEGRGRGSDARGRGQGSHNRPGSRRKTPRPPKGPRFPDGRPKASHWRPGDDERRRSRDRSPRPSSRERRSRDRSPHHRRSPSYLADDRRSSHWDQRSRDRNPRSDDGGRRYRDQSPRSRDGDRRPRGRSPRSHDRSPFLGNRDDRPRDRGPRSPDRGRGYRDWDRPRGDESRRAGRR